MKIYPESTLRHKSDVSRYLRGPPTMQMHRWPPFLGVKTGPSHVPTLHLRKIRGFRCPRDTCSNLSQSFQIQRIVEPTRFSAPLSAKRVNIRKTQNTYDHEKRATKKLKR